MRENCNLIKVKYEEKRNINNKVFVVYFLEFNVICHRILQSPNERTSNIYKRPPVYLSFVNLLCLKV